MNANTVGVGKQYDEHRQHFDHVEMLDLKEENETWI
jgi:hypothetical protein